jgi:hypothetical protein
MSFLEGRIDLVCLWVAVSLGAFLAAAALFWYSMRAIAIRKALDVESDAQRMHRLVPKLRARGKAVSASRLIASRKRRWPVELLLEDVAVVRVEALRRGHLGLVKMLDRAYGWADSEHDAARLDMHGISLRFIRKLSTSELNALPQEIRQALEERTKGLVPELRDLLLVRRAVWYRKRELRQRAESGGFDG